METRMALLITQRTVLVIAIIAFMPTMIRTQSEIPENKVIVDIRPVFLRGYDGMLQCRFNGAPLAVFWLKGADLATGTNLVTWYPPPRVVSGSGYVSGKYNLTEDFSLVIHNVTDDDAGRYICRISNFNGFILRNYTEATVQTPPQEPFPTIDQCRTEADGRGTESCILTQETGADSPELTCRTMGAPRGVVSLSWTRGDTTVTLQALQRSTNPDGVTEDVTVAIDATPSADPYVCVAILPVTTRRQATMSVTVNAAPILIATTTDSVMTTNGTDSFPEPINIKAIVIPVVIIFIIVLVVVVILILRKRILAECFNTRVRMRGYRPPKSPRIKDKGIISYFELEKLVESFNIASLGLIVAELITDSKRELEPECTKADLYKYLCAWKESSSGSAILLSSAMEKCSLENEIQIVEDFFGSTENTVSDDDLEHICWHVHSCRETVKPIVGSSYTKSSKLPDNGHMSEPPRCDEILEDLQNMKRWRAATTYGDEDEHCDETVKFSTESQEIGLKSKHTNTMPANQMIQLCRALEKAAKKTRDGDGQVYHQLSKTFYKIRKEYKSELTDEVLKKFALSITERHCQRLGNTLKLSADDIATRNEEDLKMFRTDLMLKAWMLDQKCSNYEIRRRLRQATEQCNRKDIADNFISKEQSEAMTSITELPVCLTITNEKQSHGTSASGSISVISRDELSRIGRYAGSAVLLDFCSEYGVTEIPEQQSPEGKELPFETKIINVLKPTLDSEHEKYKEGWKLKEAPREILRHLQDKHSKEPPREILRQLLQDKHPRYACLLAKGKPAEDIFNVELIDLAFRLIMADVYPFAIALNISDQVLTSYRRNLGPHKLTPDTVKIMKQVYTDDRFKLVRSLKQAGYSEEARALYFGFEISFRDVVEVENRVDKVQLAKQLGVSDDIQWTGPDNLEKDGTLHQSVLLRWRDSVCSSTFNHRLVLADALFRMEEEQLALDIISGVYRKRTIDNQMSERLAATIPETEMPSLRKLLDQKEKDGQKCQDVITAWVTEKTLIKILAKSPTKLSNELLGAGFYAFAHEIMAGAWKEDKKAGQKDGTETETEATEEPHQQGIPINEQGEKDGKEENEDMEKSTNGDKLVGNTGEEGANHGKESNKAPEEEASVNNNGTDGEQVSLDDDVKQEESGDGAAESAENTTENVDTNEQDVVQEMSRDGAAEPNKNTTEKVDTMEQGNTSDGSDEHRRKESSETSLQVKAMSRTQAFI